MTDMDWKAAMNSEIFRDYARNEIHQQIQIKAQQQEEAKQIKEDKLDLLEAFQEFERQVRSSPKKLAIFQTLQNKFAIDPEYAATVKKSFVEAVMMLDLS